MEESSTLTLSIHSGENLVAANYLEQLIAEWYEHKGFFVRRNVLVGK
jgi:hypothetical protein